MTRSRSNIRHYGVAIRALLILTVLLGLIYPLAIMLVGQVAFSTQANGSLRSDKGTVVGSALIGQSFTDVDGAPLPQWFQSRPSAAGTGYDAGASGGSNWGPENSDLIMAIAQRRQTVSDFEGVSPEAIPPDALTASASGLDPHISPTYALLQVPRVADAHALPESRVQALVQSMIAPRDLGYLGDPTVNVLELNLALLQLAG